LAIAPVCAECIKVSNERGIVDSTLLAVGGGVDCGGGGLHSSGGGGGGSGSHGCDQIIKRRMMGGVAVAVGGQAEKNNNNVGNVHASGSGDDGSSIYSRQSLRGGRPPFL